jgi:hypothetical protein
VLHTSAEQRREVREEFYAGQLLVADLTSDAPVLRTQGLVLNLSNGGMAVQTFRPLVPGQVAEIHLSLSVASVSTGKGVVTWEKEGGLAGIRFLDTPFDTFPEIPQRLQPELSPTSSDSALPLSAYRSDYSASEFDTTLHLLACSAMQLTGASGAAIALGNRSGMKCRASVGSAPELGTILSPDSGLSGYSMLKGAVVLCDDTWSDPRVNTAAAQQIDTRSIIIVPIFSDENVVGLLEAFSKDERHFNDRHLQQLQPLVDVLTDAVKEEAVSSEACDLGRVETAAITLVSVAAQTEARKDRNSSLYAMLRQFRNRPQVIAAALGLLLAVVSIAWFVYREFAKPAENKNTGVGSKSSAPQQRAIIRPEAPPFTATPIISFDPPVTSQKLGSTFGVNVVLKGARDLSSAPMRIVYDPQKLQIVSVTNGSLLDRDGQTATLVQRADSEAGRIYVSISRPLSAPGISGDGIVFTLVFLSKAPGNSRLRVDQAGLRDASTNVMPVRSSDAIITVSKSGDSNDSVPAQETTPVLTLPAPEIARARNVAPDKSSEALSSTPLPDVLPGKPLTVNDIPQQVQEPAKNSAVVLAPKIDASISDIPSFVLERTLTGHTNWVTTVVFSADGNHLVSGSWDHSVKSWDLRTGNSSGAIATEGRGIQSSAISHNGRLLAEEDASNNIRIISTANKGGDVRTLKGDRPPWDESWAYSISFSPDDLLLAAALDGRTVRLWDVNSGRVVRNFSGGLRKFVYVAFSPDGRWLATGNDSKTIAMWDVARGKLSRILKGHKQEIYAVAFSPDGRLLASASKDKTVKLWEVSTGREVHTLVGHESSVTNLAFSQNSRWLVSSSWDKTIKIWNVEDGREVQTLTGHTHEIYSLALDSRSGSIATGSADGTINLWRLRKGLDVAVLLRQPEAPNTASAASAGHRN